MKQLWEILLYPIHKYRFKRTLERYIKDVIVGDDTFFIYLEEGRSTDLHPTRAIRSAVEALCQQLYADKRLRDEFWIDGIAESIERRMRRIVQFQDVRFIGHRLAYSFRFAKGKSAKRIMFIVSDAKVGRPANPSRYMEVNDLVFDIIMKKGSKTIQPLTYSDSSRFVTLVELENHDDSSII